MPLPFAGIPDEQLLGYGVPEEWLDDVRAATEDGVLALGQEPHFCIPKEMLN